MSLFAELQRRNVIRMAGLYLVVAWLVVQVAETLLPIFGAPAWVLKTLVGLLAIGFVPTLVFAWLYELTPQGLKRDGEVPPDQSLAAQTAQRMARLIGVALVLVVALVAADRYWPRERGSESLSGTTGSVSTGARSPESDSEPLSPAPATTATAPDATAAPKRGSVAVLPFTNRSAEPDTAYFVDSVSAVASSSVDWQLDAALTVKSESWKPSGMPGTVARPWAEAEKNSARTCTMSPFWASTHST